MPSAPCISPLKMKATNIITTFSQSVIGNCDTVIIAIVPKTLNDGSKIATSKKYNAFFILNSFGWGLA